MAHVAALCRRNGLNPPREVGRLLDTIGEEASRAAGGTEGDEHPMLREDRLSQEREAVDETVAALAAFRCEPARPIAVVSAFSQRPPLPLPRAAAGAAKTRRRRPRRWTAPRPVPGGCGVTLTRRGGCWPTQRWRCTPAGALRWR